jgi:hypothetical protein
MLFSSDSPAFSYSVIFCKYRIFRKTILLLLNRKGIFENPIPVLVKVIGIFLNTGYSSSLFLFLWTLVEALFLKKKKTCRLSPYIPFLKRFLKL